MSHDTTSPTPGGPGAPAVVPLIRGARVFLRHPEVADEDEFLALRRISREVHQPWEPVTDVHPVSSEAFQRFLAASHTPTSQKHLICRNRDGAIAGYVGLDQIQLGAFCSAYMGYWMGLPHLRRGYAGEGVSLCLERAFSTLGLHRVEANIIPQNAASLATARKCGFRKEGYSPRYLAIAGRWQDHERWALTIEDWRADRRAAAARAPE